MTTQTDIPNTHVTMETTTTEIPSTTSTIKCNIKETSLFNWVNLHFNITSLQQFQEIPTLALFIQALFTIPTTNEYNHLEYIPLLLKEINLIIPITEEYNINIEAYLNGDIQEIIKLLCIVQSQYQLYTMNQFILKNQKLSFTSFTPHFIPNNLNDLQDVLYSWSNYVLSDYISASIIPPLKDLTISTWQNGVFLLALLHYHNPSLVSVTHLQQSSLSMALSIAFKHYHIPILLDNNTIVDIEEDKGDKLFITMYLTQLAICLLKPTKDEIIQRHRDIERFKNSLHHPAASKTTTTTEPQQQQTEKEEQEENIQDEIHTEGYKDKSTTFTSTFTLQQLKLTKTTITRYSDGTEVPIDLEDFESRASTLLEKMNGLQHRLMLIVPTRRSSTTATGTSYSPCSLDSNSMEFFLTDDNTTTSTRHNNDNSSHTSSMISDEQLLLAQQQQQQLVRLLHPLQAAEEDYSAYDRNFKFLQSEFQALTDGDLVLLQTYLAEELKPVWRDHPKVISRKSQILNLHNMLSMEFERSETTLEHFRRGFAFARMCSSIRHELDLVQNKMVKSITTHHDIQELEFHMIKTTGMVDTLKTNFNDLLLLASSSGDQQQQQEQDGQMVVPHVSTSQTVVDTAYLTKFESISSKNELVKSWVEEVRVWFTEAERIRQWIELRIEQLNSTTLPADPLTSIEIPASRDQVEAWNATHSVLEKEIELFDKEDMTRLRSHVKQLTGSSGGSRADKDLSPADTTTIEITLTTLMTLDKLMHLLRRKSYDLQVLTQRVIWEEEYVKAMDWLKETDGQVDMFLKTSARWTSAEEVSLEEDKRERLMAKENQKEIIVQQLLTLERKMAEFDQGQFTKTVDSFQDLDNTSSVELPTHLESRQDACEQLFEDLMKRMTFARNVVEQRLNVMDFLYQTEMVVDDAKHLQQEIVQAESKAHPGENGRDMTTRVQSMHERIVQLVTVAAGRIPYPVPGLAMDKELNTLANQEIGQVITNKRNQLILLSEDLDERLHGFRNVLQLHRRCKEHLDDATRLCDWAEERVKSIRKAKVNLQDTSAFTVQDLQRLERDRDNIINKLKNNKENEVVDLLTSISLLLETGQNISSSLDKEGLLVDASQQLEETFDRLQQVLEEHGLDLEALRKRMQDGNTYFENARSLRAFMNETRHSMPALKQSCGFMTGQSQQQDKDRFDMLNQALDKINTDYKDQQIQFAQLCCHFRLMEPSKIENMEEMRAMQAELENDWRTLGQEIQELETFSHTVGEWYDRQRRLSVVENDLINGLNEEITRLAKSGSWTDADLQVIQDKLNKATSFLKEVGDQIHAADNKQDPLQTANYSCARDRHSLLFKRVNAASNNLNALKNNANQAIAYSAFLGESERLFAQVQQQQDIIDRRMTSVGVSDFATQSMSSIDTLCKATQTATLGSERETQQLAKKLEALMVTAKELESEGYDNSSVYDPIKRIKEKLAQLSNTINLEKKQAMFIRKIHIHAKAANDLQTWIDHCSNAITNLPTDVCMTDEQELVAELDNLEQKMLDMRPTIQAFEAMPSRIFATKDGSSMDLGEISLEPAQIKQAVKDREATLLKAWADLKKQHQLTRQSVESSKRGVDIARKVKSILQQVGDMKDRVAAVRICKTTHLAKGGDLQTVLTCPLTSIPNEHRLASAKAELTILDRDMETHLQPSIQELDIMLNKMRSQDAEKGIFSGQRDEISIAVRGLMDLVKSKRRAIAEAKKLEDFLTVMEETEVLLLAVGEVVSRASLSNARMVDGQCSRADLQALLIDLDTRYRYYEPKINELLDELKEVGEKLLDDQRVVDCIKQFSDKWLQLQAEAAAKKADLLERIGPLGDTFDILDNLHEGMLQERGRRAASQLAKRTSTPELKQPPRPQSMQSTPRYMTGYTRTTKPSFTSGSPPPLSTAARANAAANKRPTTTTGGTISPTARRVAVRQMVAQQQRQRAAAVKTPETYVADPQNDLDVALGDIVNDSPYKIQVKMVPGEVGKYWFGDVNPKLAYCRILRSRMVMVRVGGGWVELSQFLTDHALLEGGNFVSGARSRTSLPPPSSGGIRDGFLNTTVGRNAPISIRGGNGGEITPTMRESRSTPFHQRGKSPTPFGHGIKTGNKFLVTVDNDGNRVEVKMTKAKSKDTKFITPRRMNI